MATFFSLFSHNVSVDNCVLENNSHILTLRRHSLKVESLLQYLLTLTGIDGMRVMTFLVYNSFYTVEFEWNIYDDIEQGFLPNPTPSKSTFKNNGVKHFYKNIS